MSPMCFKSCPREGASYEGITQQEFVDVSSRAPVRGHHSRRKVSRPFGVFQVVPP